MINVVDRVPTYPNRVKITHSNGTSEFVTWERADEPTVPGTPINKALFDSIVEDVGLNAHKTVYVSTAGSDTLGDGTAANPYATINKALSVIPKNLNGYTAYVNIAPGTYYEKVEIAGFASGEIGFTGTPGSVISMSKLTIDSTTVFSCQNIQLYVAPNGQDTVAIDVTGNSFAAFGQPITVENAETGVVVREEAKVRFAVLTANGITSTAVYANGGKAHVQSLAGSNNGIAINANRGGVVTYESMSMTSDVKFFASNGGRIYSGSQTSIPNY